MHNLKEIRKNIDLFRKKVSERNTKINLDNLIEIDKKNRNLIQKKESLEQEKKLLSKSKNEGNFKKNLENDPEVMTNLTPEKLTDCFSTELHQSNLKVIWDRLGI